MPKNSQLLANRSAEPHALKPVKAQRPRDFCVFAVELHVACNRGSCTSCGKCPLHDWQERWQVKLRASKWDDGK